LLVLNGLFFIGGCFEVETVTTLNNWGQGIGIGGLSVSAVMAAGGFAFTASHF
jgi:hypothetical protein